MMFISIIDNVGIISITDTIPDVKELTVSLFHLNFYFTLKLMTTVE